MGLVFVLFKTTILLTCVAAVVELVEPVVISSSKSVWSASITVEEYEFFNSELSFNTRAYCYMGTCSHPGPTIQVKPGDHFTLTVTNKLGKESPESSSGVLNTMHSPNTTNVHTHGLHISPDVDSIFVEIAPGEVHVYNYEIHESHLPGTHWYHSHIHGSSSLQVMGGLVGAFIVAPQESFQLPEAITSWKSIVLVFTFVQFSQVTGTVNGTISVSQGCAPGAICRVEWQSPLCTGSEIESPFTPFRIFSYLELSAEVNSDMRHNLVFNGTEENYYFTNGQYVPTITMDVNEKRILKMIHAVGGEQMDLELKSGAGECSMTVIAWDGVYLRAPYKTTTLTMMAASRVDVVLTCTDPGQYFLRNTINNLTEILITDSLATDTLTITEDDLSMIKFPSYLDDLQGDDIVVNDAYEIYMSQVGRGVHDCIFWIGGGIDCTPLHVGTANASEYNTDCPSEYFDGQQGSNISGYKHVTTVGAINEWTIYGVGTVVHPLHLHVNHMQIINFTYAGTEDIEVWEQAMAIGQWRDTVPTFNGELTVRFKASDFSGEHILHCHFLHHEDLGMMDSIYVKESDDSEGDLSDTETCEFKIETTNNAMNTSVRWILKSTSDVGNSSTVADIPGTTSIV